MANDKAGATYHPGDEPPPRHARRPPGDGWSWAGAVALVLAVCLGVGWAVALVLAVEQGDPIPPRAATFLTTAGGALLAGLGGWLGASVVRRNRGPGDR